MCYLKSTQKFDPGLAQLSTFWPLNFTIISKAINHLLSTWEEEEKFSNWKKDGKYMKFPVGINIASNDKRSHGYPGQVHLSENDLKHHTAAAKYSSPSSAYLKSAILLLFTVYRRISSSPSTPCTSLGDHPNLMSWWPFTASFCRQPIAKS